MNFRIIVERLVYVLVVVLSVVALWLFLNAPQYLLNARVVYQAF
jgi:hypothetical protein